MDQCSLAERNHTLKHNLSQISGTAPNISFPFLCRLLMSSSYTKDLKRAVPALNDRAFDYVKRHTVCILLIGVRLQHINRCIAQADETLTELKHLLNCIVVSGSQTTPGIPHTVRQFLLSHALWDRVHGVFMNGNPDAT